MQKFKFSLRSVASLRALQEMKAREVFTASIHVYVEAQKNRDTVRHRIAELEDIMRSGRRGVFRASDQVAFMQAMQREQNLEQEADKKVNETKVEMERCRQLWAESRRDVKLMEKLEQKARRTHAIACEHEEQSAMDDRTCALRARAN